MFEIEAKKSLGQNFLKNPAIIHKMVEAGNILPGDFIVEIGPGTGLLTAEILKKFDALESASGSSLNPDNQANYTAKNKLIAIEKDSRAIPILKQKFNTYIEKGQFELIEGDFLEIHNIADLLSEKKPKGDQKSNITPENKAKIIKNDTKTGYTSFKIIANIPYYITGAIVRKSLELAIKPNTMVLLVQKEVAERIAQKDQKGSILSESINAYGRAEYLFTVAKGNFVPAPKVDSAAIRISGISNERFAEANITESDFFLVLKAGFAHKRKKLAGNIKDFFVKKTAEASLETHNAGQKEGADKNKKFDFDEILIKLGLSKDIRAEELGIEHWFALASALRQAGLF